MRSHGLEKKKKKRDCISACWHKVLPTHHFSHLFSFGFQFLDVNVPFTSFCGCTIQSPCRCTLYINEGKPFLHAVDLRLSPTYVKYVSVRDRNRGTTNLRCHAATFANSMYPGYVRRPDGELTVRFNPVARLHNTYGVPWNTEIDWPVFLKQKALLLAKLEEKAQEKPEELQVIDMQEELMYIAHWLMGNYDSSSADLARSFDVYVNFASLTGEGVKERKCWRDT